MVDHPPIGGVVGDPSALEGSGEFRQQTAAGPGEDADRGVAKVLFYMDALHLAGYPLGFGAGLVEYVGLDPAGMRGGNHRSGSSRKIATCHHPESSAEDRFRNPKAGCQDQTFGRFPVKVTEPVAEIGDVGKFGPPERVDRLVGVAGDGEVAMGESGQLQEPGLGWGGVLVLVDKHKKMLGCHRPGDLGLFESADGHGEQRSVVDATPGEQFGVVTVHEVGERPPLRPLR